MEKEPLPFLAAHELLGHSRLTTHPNYPELFTPEVRLVRQHDLPADPILDLQRILARCMPISRGLGAHPALQMQDFDLTAEAFQELLGQFEELVQLQSDARKTDPTDNR